MYIRNFILLILVLVLAACADERASETSAVDAETTPVDQASGLAERTYVPGKRIGAITSDMTIADLERMYGKQAVKATTLSGAEGNTYEGHLLFAGTDDELEMNLDGGTIGAESNNAGGHWACAEHGLRIGTSLRDLNRINGGPFTFSGFEWDYGGLPIDFKGGALEGHSFRMAYENFYDEEMAIKFMGDETFSSDAPGLEDLDIRVDALYMLIE